MTYTEYQSNIYRVTDITKLLESQIYYFLRVGVLSGSRNAAISSSFMSFAGGLLRSIDTA
jgi:hypothetical protein